MIEDSLEPRLEELTEDILNLKEGAQSTQPLNTVDVEDQRGIEVYIRFNSTILFVKTLLILMFHSLNCKECLRRNIAVLELQRMQIEIVLTVDV